MRQFVRVASLEEIPEGGGTAVEAGGREIALFRVEGEIYAIDNVCPHLQGPLVEGILEGRIVSCPWHAWTFDVGTGRCTFSEDVRVERFEVRIRGTDVEVSLDLD